MRHRFMAVIGVAAVMLIASAVPSRAAAPVYSASAFWDLDDAFDTHVSIQGNEQKGKNGDNLFFHVTQVFCDSDTNERVIRSFDSSGPIQRRAFKVVTGLTSASLVLNTTAAGSEQRQPDCDPTAQPSPPTSLGQVPVSMNLTWTGTGDTYVVQPGVIGRAATATGTITGTLLNPGSLGDSQFAELRSNSL